MKTPLRIYHYDIARGAYLTPEYFGKALRLAAASGFTHFVPYLEKMIRLPSIEKSCPACAYTPEHWRQFEAVAGDAGIELMPHFNVIGHTGSASAYPELLTRGPDGGSLDVTLEATRAWTKRCLGEFCAFSKSRYFLIGGDEWQPPNHLLATADFNVVRAWADQINLACDYLVSKGRSPIVWHDMLAHYPEGFDFISRDAVIAFWYYDEDSDYPFLDMLKARGFKTIMAPGTCSGLVSRRIKRALDCAMKASDRYAVDGFMMTNWENTRWEKQSMTIPSVGALLRGETLPERLLDAAALMETLEKLPAEIPFAQKCRARLSALLSDKALKPYPEFQNYLDSVLTADRERERASLLRYHFPEGPYFAALAAKKGSAPKGMDGVKTSGQGTAEPSVSEGSRSQSGEFRLVVQEKEREGAILRFVNADETFVIYPRFGGSLQDWRLGTATIIPHSLPQFLKNGARPPGGLNSYSGVGGFRPIWALGVHTNPCILWQGPFEWKTVVEADDQIVVELARHMFHVDVCYTISLRKGTPGFVFQAQAINKLDAAYGAFNFNLVLAVQREDLEETEFSWLEPERGQEHRLRLLDQCDSFFRLPAVDKLTVRKPGYSVSIHSNPAKTAGFYVDWSTAYLTPDLRGFYRKMGLRESETVEWQFGIKQ